MTILVSEDEHLFRFPICKWFPAICLFTSVVVSKLRLSVQISSYRLGEKSIVLDTEFRQFSIGKILSFTSSQAALEDLVSSLLFAFIFVCKQPLKCAEDSYVAKVRMSAMPQCDSSIGFLPAMLLHIQ